MINNGLDKAVKTLEALLKDNFEKMLNKDILTPHDWTKHTEMVHKYFEAKEKVKLSKY